MFVQNRVTEIRKLTSVWKYVSSEDNPTDCPIRGMTFAESYNVGLVLWRLFSTLEVVQYIERITLVLWGDSFSTVMG